ncbi:RNA 2',3'-cyclic phosphodiesterase [Thalassotalea sediminis]|uniref:RNA 2',3'-cyclic phosphodiesterase n=1 Tax=Thalassotalea sediminis TaxID=1759089 RepID=UPI002574644C|nr:RNA 2',3'-cyclic phosphodiesterase [Thalassotalea sediminis]
MKRMFFALDISNSDKQYLAKWRQQILLNAKPVSQENFHITLSFLGMLSDLQIEQLITFVDAQNLLSKQAPFEICATQLGLFKKPQVLYLAFQNFPKPLSRLAYNLSHQASIMGITQHHPSFLPHITLFRKAKEIPQQQTKSEGVSIMLTISQFSLYHSYSTNEGVRYKPIRTWSFTTNKSLK